MGYSLPSDEERAKQRFDNPYPCHDNGDPMTLGEPCLLAYIEGLGK